MAIINRQQRREYDKKMRKLEKANPKLFGMMKQYEWLKQKQDAMRESGLLFKPGDRVQINLESVRADPDYEHMRKDRIEWIEAHVNDIYTVEYDPKFTDNPMFVCFTEDEHDPKWLWFVGDLKKVEDEG